MATLIFPEHPSPVADAEALKKAFQGWGTNEKAIISILGHRNAVQRKLIRKAYEDMYAEDLVKRLESELSGDFEKVIYRWILDPEERDAVLLNVAIKHKPSPDYRVIVEFSTIYNPEEFLAVKRAYQHRFKHSLEEDIAQHTTGDLRKLLVGLASPYKYAGGEMDVKLAKSEADKLQDLVKDKALNHEEVIRIITTRSNAQIVAALNHYKDSHGTAITKHLKDDPANDYLAALLTAIRSINNPQKHYEKVLRIALNKPGTDEDAITRVIVTRAEKDLNDIKDIYYKRNSVALDHAISNETSSHYKAFLLALLGKD
ncbi:annexin-like protein RJ4 [Coffea eugenioides]|uniref:Annexin n=1 Tax=Coffea arabica TaxID=13443 RepID=A0A6P6W5S0_COFAR|nr:annexin-like protein RJ4 [Coffea arabica]XP_027158413.1 annexin-like protein RJ4 [Coffea eugenioides]